jgi:hypothetical protein
VANPALYRSHGEQVLLPEDNGWQAAYQRLMAAQYEGAQLPQPV